MIEMLRILENVTIEESTPRYPYKEQFARLPEDLVEPLDVVSYGDIHRAVLKTPEL